MKNKIILIIGSNQPKKEKILEELHKKLNFSYIKYEALLSSIAETLNRNVTEQESINFFNRFIDNIKKGNEVYVIDINDCKEETLNRYINNKEIYKIKVDENELTDLMNEISTDIANI